MFIIIKLMQHSAFLSVFNSRMSHAEILIKFLSPVGQITNLSEANN